MSRDESFGAVSSCGLQAALFFYENVLRSVPPPSPLREIEQAFSVDEKQRSSRRSTGQLWCS